MPLYIGCAGWNLRKEFAEQFPAAGSHLERYAARFQAVEINSSFYRPHRPSTYRRWADSTPEAFRFAVKLPKQITHKCRLVETRSELEQFALETSGLGDKLGPVLVQLPPSLSFERQLVIDFLSDLRKFIKGPVVCEPRHASWFEAESESLLSAYSIGRVAADPAVVAQASLPGGWEGIRYYRWHGSPRIYYSSYDGESLRALGDQLRRATSIAEQVWAIFDNTALGAATENALSLSQQL